jgi:hypothetical protein
LTGKGCLLKVLEACKDGTKIGDICKSGDKWMTDALETVYKPAKGEEKVSRGKTLLFSLFPFSFSLLYFLLPFLSALPFFSIHVHILLSVFCGLADTSG